MNTVAGGAPRDELRLALSMRGGVSLAVWIGGAAAEINRLTQASGAGPQASRLDSAYSALLDIANYDRAVIDVITGASAGGLNGAILAASRVYGFDFDEMCRIWVELADIELMCRDPTATYEAPDGSKSRRAPSVLDGDGYFLARLRETLADLIGSGNNGTPDPFTLVLSATLVEPGEDRRDEDPFSELLELRSAASFTFRHVGETGDANGGDFQSRETAKGTLPNSTSSLLALAGRATSSFPAAFEPATVTTAAGNVFSDPPAPGGQPRQVMDGGVLDNIPVTKAIEAIAALPAVAGSDRWLMYLHPSPSTKGQAPILAQQQAAPRALATGLRALAAGAGQEALRDDLNELRAFNDAALRQRNRRDAALHAAFGNVPAGDRDARIAAVCAAAVGSAGQFARNRAQVDAPRALGVLDGTIRVRRPVGDAADRARHGVLDGHRADLEPIIADALTEAFTWRPEGWPESGTSFAGEAFAETAGAAGTEGAVGALLSPGATAQAAELVEGWIRRLPARGRVVEPGLLRTLSRRAAELRTVAAMMLDWSDQSWLAAAAAGTRLNTNWVEEAARSASHQARALPSDLVGRLAEELKRIEGTTRGAIVRVLDALDSTVRERIAAGTYPGKISGPPPPASGDLALNVWAWLAALVNDVNVAAGSIPSESSGQPADALLDRPGTTANSAAVVAAAGPVVAVDDPSPAIADPVTPAPAVTDQSTPTVIASLVVIHTPTENSLRPSSEPIRFVRVSGANESPIERLFLEHGESHLSPDDKLCGNELGNFAAFLSARWRLNDWMWGRLDGIKSIVDLLMRPERIHASGLTADELLEKVETILAGSNMKLQTLDRAVVKLELGAAADSPTSVRGTARTRRAVTEALQRQVLAEMVRQVLDSDEAPTYKQAAASQPEVKDQDELLSRYRVGRETIANLDSRRRTQVGMRAAMVTWHALRPGGDRVRTKVARRLLAIIKPIYLYTMFGVLNRARAVFLVDLMLTGWLVGPWTQRDIPLTPAHQPFTGWTAVIDHGGWLRSGWPPFRRGKWNPEWTRFHGATWLLVVAVAVLGVSALVLLVRNLRRNRGLRRRGHVAHGGTPWYVGTVLVSTVLPVAFRVFGIGPGPVVIAVFAGAIGVFATWWMDRGWSVLVGVGTTVIYAVVAAGLWLIARARSTPDAPVFWARYSMWWSFVALYASMAFIATLCTYVSVLPRRRAPKTPTSDVGSRRQRSNRR